MEGRNENELCCVIPYRITKLDYVLVELGYRKRQTVLFVKKGQKLGEQR